MGNKEEVRSPFQWRDNTLDERPRMRNERKKRKRHLSKKGNRKSKSGAVIKGLIERLQNESPPKRAIAFSSKKILQEMETNQRGFEISTGEHCDATLNLSLWDTGKGNPKYFSVLTNHFMLFKHVYTQIIQY